MTGQEPFTHRIRVGWADCDPARIAYTGRIPYFALEAIDAWWAETVGEDWYRMNVDHGTGTPFVHLSMDFKSPVTPRHPLDCEVRMLKLGNSSIRFSVDGFQESVLCFSGEFVEVFVEASSMSKTGVPERFRTSLLKAIQQ